MKPQRGWTIVEGLVIAALVCAVVTGALDSMSERVIQTRNVRARVNLAEIARGLEAYQIDWGVYPYDGYSYQGSGGWHDYNYWYLPIELTTPVPYLDGRLCVDPHRVEKRLLHWQSNQIRYTCSLSTWGTLYDQLISGGGGASVYLDEVLEEWGEWRLNCAGPDTHYGPSGWQGISSYPAAPIPYDPTNGIQSEGDIQRSQTSPVGYRNIPQEP